MAEQRIQGRWVREEEILGLRNWIEGHRDWSRKRFVRELWLASWEWREARGRLKEFAARRFLLKPEAQGVASHPVPRPIIGVLPGSLRSCQAGRSRHRGVSPSRK